MNRSLPVIFLIFLAVLSCRRQQDASVEQQTRDETAASSSRDNSLWDPDYDTTLWTEILPSGAYILDIRYATTNNFVNEKIYPCGRMFLRKDAARALDNVRLDLEMKGYGLKLFDGYRPRQAQQKLWEKVPNPDYVAPPAEGSMHNRGVAIDLTLTDLDGKEIEMGTEYDFFGPEAHQDYMQLPEDVLKHRQLLKSSMEAHGFQGIRTEWWHYSYVVKSFPLESWVWECQ